LTNVLFLARYLLELLVIILKMADDETVDIVLGEYRQQSCGEPVLLEMKRER